MPSGLLVFRVLKVSLMPTRGSIRTTTSLHHRKVRKYSANPTATNSRVVVKKTDCSCVGPVVARTGSCSR